VLGHVLGFGCGVALGSLYALLGMPRSRRLALQALCGALALASVATAWAFALRAALG
jgi:hypothetical protein